MNIEKCDPDPRGSSLACDIRNKAHDLEALIRRLPGDRRRAKALSELEASVLWAERACKESGQG